MLIILLLAKFQFIILFLCFICDIFCYYDWAPIVNHNLLSPIRHYSNWKSSLILRSWETHSFHLNLYISKTFFASKNAINLWKSQSLQIEMKFAASKSHYDEFNWWKQLEQRFDCSINRKLFMFFHFETTNGCGFFPLYFWNFCKGEKNYLKIFMTHQQCLLTNNILYFPCPNPHQNQKKLP